MESWRYKTIDFSLEAIEIVCELPRALNNYKGLDKDGFSTKTLYSLLRQLIARLTWLIVVQRKMKLEVADASGILSAAIIFTEDLTKVAEGASDEFLLSMLISRVSKLIVPAKCASLDPMRYSQETSQEVIDYCISALTVGKVIWQKLNLEHPANDDLTFEHILNMAFNFYVVGYTN